MAKKFFLSFCPSCLICLSYILTNWFLTLAVPGLPKPVRFVRRLSRGFSLEFSCSKDQDQGFSLGLWPGNSDNQQMSRWVWVKKYSTPETRVFLSFSSANKVF